MNVLSLRLFSGYLLFLYSAVVVELNAAYDSACFGAWELAFYSELRVEVAAMTPFTAARGVARTAGIALSAC